MARIRSVHPDICVSETLAAARAGLERTFVRLWTHCDDQGRAVDNVKLIKAALYPLLDEQTSEVVDQELDALAEHGLIVRYEVDGRRYLQVTGWHEYQHPNRPVASKLPPPAEPTLGGLSEHAVSPHERLTPGVGDGDRRWRGVGDARSTVARGEIEPPGFHEFWTSYPRKVARKAALKAWPKAAADDGIDVIASGLRIWLDYWHRSRTEQQYVPHPATWLNQRRYSEDPGAIAPTEPRGFAGIRAFLEADEP